MRKKTISFLTVLGGLVFCAYLYFFSTIVFATAGQQSDGLRLAQLRSELGTLEARYRELSSKITLGTAYELGFVDMSNRTDFVTARTDGHFLARRPDR